MRHDNISSRDQYEEKFPEQIVAQRESIEERIGTAKEELYARKNELTEFGKVEELYLQLDSFGAVKTDYDRDTGQLIMTCWLSDLDFDEVKILLQNYGGEVVWDDDDGFYRVEAVVWTN